MGAARGYVRGPGCTPDEPAGSCTEKWCTCGSATGPLTIRREAGTQQIEESWRWLKHYCVPPGLSAAEWAKSADERCLEAQWRMCARGADPFRQLGELLAAARARAVQQPALGLEEGEAGGLGPD